MLYTPGRFHSELQCSNVEEGIVLLLLIACMYLFSVSCIFGIVCLREEIKYLDKCFGGNNNLIIYF